MSPSGAATLFCALALSLAPTPSPVVVAPPEFDESLDETRRASLRGAIEQGLAKGGIAGAGAAEGSEPCNAAECVRELATEAGARRVITTTVQKQGPDFVIQLSLWDALDGKIVADVEDTCEICGLAELEDALVVASNSLARKVEQMTRSAVLAIDSRPTGASVLVDGETIGTTPTSLTLPPGSHLVTVRLAGHDDSERKIELVAGVDEDLVLTLEPTTPDSTGKTDQPAPGRGLRISGYSLLGGGIAAAAAGVTLIVLDERPFGACQADIDGDCRQRYDSLEAGIALAVAGGVLVGTAIGLIVAGHRKGKRGETARAILQPSGGLAVRF